MKKILALAALAVSIIAVGCNCTPPAESNPQTSNADKPETAAVQVAYDLGSIKKGDKAHCCVCAADGQVHGEETVAETIDYEGKTYGFCNEAEKATFISDPSKFAKK